MTPTSQNIEINNPAPGLVALKRWGLEYFIPGAILLTLLGYILRYPDRINHDCALILNCAKVLAQGGYPYIDFVDVNPPLVFYINVIPVLIAKVSGLGLPLVFSLSTLFLLFVSTLAAQFLLKNRALALAPWIPTFIVSAALLLSLFFYGSADFGQREHLFAMVFFPWFWCRVVRCYDGEINSSVATLVGVMAGIGACLKPHFLMIVLSIELVAVLRRKNVKALLKPEVLGFLFVGFAYGVHFLFLPPFVKEALFNRWLPFIARYYPRADQDLFSWYIHHRYVIPTGIGLALLSIAVVVAVRQGGRRSILIELTATAFVASLISLWIQQKGYSYHLIPVKLSLILLVLSLSIWWYEGSVRREGVLRYVSFHVRGIPAALLGMGLLFFSVKELVVPGVFYKWYESFEPLRKAILENSTETDRVTFMSKVIGAYPTLVQVNRQQGSRFPADVPSVGMYADSLHHNFKGEFSYRKRSEMPPEEVRILEEVSEDIVKQKPKLIFINVSDSCYAWIKGFNVGKYLAQSGFLDDAMRNYTMIGLVDEHEMYVRQDHGGTGLPHRE